MSTQELQVLDNPVTPEHVTIQDRLMKQIVEMLQGQTALTAYKVDVGGKYSPDTEQISLKVSDTVSLFIIVSRSKS